MARLSKEARMEMIASLRSTKGQETALDGRRAAKTSQSIVRPLGEVPVAEKEPKHLSSAYKRNGLRRYKVSQWLETYRLYISEQARELAIPERRAKCNPLYSPIAAPRPRHQNGPQVFTVQGSTQSRETAQAVNLQPKTVAYAESLLRAIPADTKIPDDRAKREWATWYLEFPARIAAGKAIDAQRAATRQYLQSQAVKEAAFNARHAALESRLSTFRRTISTLRAAIHGTDQTSHTSYFSTPLFANRAKLSSLVPLASK